MDLKKVQVNEISFQMKSLKNQYTTLNSSIVTLYSKEKSPHNYHRRASQESNFIFQQRKSCLSKTITIFKYRKRYKPYILKKDSDGFCKKKKPEIMRKYSLPILRNIDYYTTLNSKTKSSDEIILRKSNPFKMNYIVNVTSRVEHSYYFRNSFFKPSYKIYRCQFNIQEESCCCSCNSDAMFEVMKSLYDCYKKKNCDHCNCILCGHLPREERLLGEMRKSAVGIKDVSEKKIKERRKTKAKKVKDVSSLLKDKTAAEKEKILEDLVASGVPLPEGKTKSEKELIKKVKTARRLSAESIVPKAEAIISKKQIPSAKLRKAKEAGLLTPLEGKTSKQKENILRGLAMNGIPLPAGKTSSDKKLIDKVRKDVGLPPEPLTASDKKKYNNALESGLITPLEGKSPSEKEKILKGLANLGIQLPEGRSSSEKALVAKVKAEAQVPLEIAGKPEKSKVSSRALIAEKALSEKLRKAKAEGLLTPLEGKSVEQKQKILKDLAKHGIPLPEGKTASDKKLIDKVIEEMGLPPQPKTSSAKQRYQKAVKAGLVTPLEGKSTPEKEKFLKGLADLGVELPVGRTASEKSLIAKVKASAPVPSEVGVKPEKVKTKSAGLVSPLRGKTPEQKEEVLKNLAMTNVPLPEGKTPSEKVLINKVRADVGLPLEPKSKSEKEKYKQAEAAGLIVPLEGKTPAEKEKILQGQADFGLPLPKGRTPSEKSLIKKIKQSEKKKVKSREKGVGPPVLPLEKRKKLDAKTFKAMKEGKGPSDECICGLLTPEEERISRVSKLSPPLKIPSAKLKSAKMAGLLTPLEGKSQAQKEKILKDLAKRGIPLPEPKTASEKKIMQKVQNDLGLPPVPQTPSLKEKYAKAQVAGVITPLEGKTPLQKEKILNKQAQMGIDLPAGRTASEKALINKIQAGKPSDVISKKIRKVSLEGKTPEEKERILRNLAKAGLPLPEGKTPSEKQLIKKVKEDVALKMKSPEFSEKLRKAKAAGLLTPLEGKTPAQKEEIIRRQLAAGLPLPEPKSPSEKKFMKDVIAKSSKLLHGKTPSQKEKILRNIAKQGLPLPESKTPSDKAIIEKVQAEVRVPPEMAALSAKLRQARAAGLLTPLEGKSGEEKEKILKDLAKAGIPLPEAKSPSEKKILEKVRQDLGLPPESKTLSIKEKMKQAQAAGIITPLEGKTPSQKEKVLKKMHEAGIPLPKGRTGSEKALIKKIKGEVTKEPSKDKVPSEKLREAKAKGLFTPLEGKTPAQKEKKLRGLAKSGLPLPEGKTPSEKALIHKIQAEEGIVSTRPSPSIRPSLPPDKLKKLDKSTAKGMKESKGLSDECICDLLTPESEREKISMPAHKKLSQKIPSEKLPKAKAAGFLTPLEGKTPEQKEKILKGLAMQKIPLPEPKTASEKRIHDKVRADLGLTPQPKTRSAKENYNKAIAAGLITPLEGKSAAQKEKILKAQAELGLPLPEGRTSSEKALITKVKASVPKPVEKELPLEKIQKLQAAGILTPLEGKTPEQKEKILKDMAVHGVPLPKGKTTSEKKIIDKVRASVGLPPEPKTSFEKVKYKKAIAAGLITPLQGKSEAQKEKILRGQKEIGLKLPEPRTPSEKALIQKIKETVPSLKGVPSENIRKSKAPELVALEGKTPEQKEKILKDLALKGIPLPEPKTSSEKKIINKVRAEVGLPTIPKTASLKEKYDKAKAEGLITPLHGKSAAQKEKILRGQAQMGLPLPEGRTASEKALIAKIKATPAAEVPKLAKSIEKVSRPALPPEKVAKLDKKTAKIMKEGKGPSDKCICGILTPETKKAPVGAPPIKAPKEAEMLKVPSKKIRKAKAAGLMTPLKGKTPEQKEKILKELAMQGIPLPETKTASEMKLIDKVRNEVGLPSEPKTPSMKLKYNKAIADDVIVPLEGKTNDEKEKILRNQAALGLPLPVGRTASEKVIIAKIKEAIPSEKIRKAKTAGLLTPLEGKTPEKKEKILKGLLEAGLPLPEGKTPSEKALVQKVKTKAGVTPELAISDKGKIKTKSKRVGAPGVHRSIRGVGVTKSKGGVVEEFQDIIKTTTCDRGCGCDKKKIRFKHSYVKIRVTSPDISSLCPCPEECVPGVKGGVFTDNEGIKVTVGRVTCVSSNSSRRLYRHENCSSLTCVPKFNILLNDKNTNVNELNNISKSETEISLQECFKKYQRFSNGYIPNEFNGKVNKTNTSTLFLKNEESSTSLQYDYSLNISNSFDSIYFLKTNSSLSLITLPSTASVWSFSTTSISTNSSLDKQSLQYYTNNYENLQSMLMLQDTNSKISNVSLDLYKCFSENKKSLLEFPMYRENNLDNDIQIIYRVSDVHKEILDNVNHDNYVAYVDGINDKEEILKVFNRILSKTQLKNSSSIIIIVASSSDGCSTSNDSSTICLELSEDRPNWNPGTSGLHHVYQKQKGFKITKRRNLRHVVETNSSHVLPKTHEVKKSYTTLLNQENNEYRLDSGWNKLKIISTDTTEDRPCCCNVVNAKNVGNNKTTQRLDNLVSEFVTPMILEEVVAQGLINDSYILDLPLANAKRPSHLTIHQSNCCKTTPVRLCKIPSCSGHQSCHADKSSNIKTLAQPPNILNPNLYKSCDCSSTKLKEIFEKNTIQLISKACGDSKEKLHRKHVKLGHERIRKPYVITTRDNKCNSCSSSKSLKSCISSDKNKKQLCPCEQHHKISNLDNYSKELNYKTEDSNLKNKCHCKDRTRLKNKKNIICECPEEPEPEIEIDENEWLDEKQLRKIQSALTQTTSGFKIKIPKKKSDSELSFEEALRYFAENLESDQINEEICDCNGKSKKTKITKCECPYEPNDFPNEEETPTIEEPFTGIKFHIDGKGTASKGLSGILCFE